MSDEPCKKFIVRNAKVGNNYSVFYALEYGPTVEITGFASEAAAHHSVANDATGWLEKLEGRR
jgi:hypothetical protein